MRVAIREQLAALVVLTVLIALAILSIPVWVYVNSFVVEVESNGLALTASLKAAQIASELELLQTTVLTISTRLLLQKAFQDYYQGNTAESNWNDAHRDLLSALQATGTSTLFQAKLYSRNTTGDAKGLLEVSGNEIQRIKLPYTSPNGSEVFLGDTEDGYPPSLFPNITFVATGKPNSYMNSTAGFRAFAFPDVVLSHNGGLVLGPMVIDETLALLSITVPIRDNNNTRYILGYMTLVASAAPLVNIRNSREGLGKTGVALVIGPASASNRFNASSPASNSTYLPPDQSKFGMENVHFVLPPVAVDDHADRHEEHSYDSGSSNTPWPLHRYPALLREFSERFDTVNNASSDLSATNEQGVSVSVGLARPQTSLVNWTVVVEQARHEAFTPITTLRNILLGCVFGTVGVVVLLIFPCAHISVMPIRRLKHATEKSIAPPGYQDELDDFEDDDVDGENPTSGATSHKSEKTLMSAFLNKMGYKYRGRPKSHSDRDSSRRVFKIPGKVRDRKHFVTDELTELTETFNDMSDELLKQCTSLDAKVSERTRELEISKKAAEAANESKTLFIANISHELKTPLNGILGMCTVCMEEDDILKIKQSLKLLYKSGDLLLHLLEDLLSFSKNQIGQQLNLEEKEFRLGDVRSQVLTIFDKQVREKRINFSVTFIGTENIDTSDEQLERPAAEPVQLPALGPPGIGRLKDMCLWGDQHRILQVIINLVSNSLKFTPEGGRVDVRIRCTGEVEHRSDDSRTSSFSRGSGRVGRARHRGSTSNYSASSKGAATNTSPYKGGTALSINPMEQPKATQVQIRERSPTPPPPNAKAYTFEIEVEDSGPGIPEHMRQRVFEPFVQGDIGLSKKFGGTGLGLSICSQLAGLMGGSISLRSTIGVGSVFTMVIPLKYVKDRPSSTASSSMKSRTPSVTSMEGEKPRSSLQKPAADSSTAATVLNQQPRLVGLSQPFFAADPKVATTNGSKEDHMAAIDRAMANKADQGKLRVLVADDNPLNIEVVRRMLQLEHVYDVTIAKDGQEAYDMVKAAMEKNEEYHVILMDLGMPNIDGLQSTRLIRGMGYSAPIVALTALTEESNVKACMDSGMNEFLSKPLRRPALRRVLQKFAPIPEEPETASIATRKTSPDRRPKEQAADGTFATASEEATLKEGTDAQPNGTVQKPL